MSRVAASTVGLLAGVALASLLAACAKVGPPPGGPEDREAPSVLTDALSPAPGSAGVHADEPIRIVFSERLDQRSVMRNLTVIPRVDYRDVAWSEDTLRIVPADGWAADRPTILRISTGAKDRRGNAMESIFQFRFTTQVKADSGRITGKVWPGRERTTQKPLVLLAIDSDDVLELDDAAPYAITTAATDGTYALAGLDVARSWRIVGLIDEDDDLRAEGRGEAFAFAPDPIQFPPGETEVQAPEFLVGTLDSLGTISGESEADSAAAVFVQAENVDDGALFRDGPAEGGGSFAIAVPTGAVYRVLAFVDADGDSLPDEDETVVRREEPVSLRFTGRESSLRFDLKSEPEVENLELEGDTPPGSSTSPEDPEAGP